MANLLIPALQMGSRLPGIEDRQQIVDEGGNGDFAAGSTWICFSDQTPHAALARTWGGSLREDPVGWGMR
ncbi:hypothetical protein AE02_00697 [Klebsiella variicola]|nr:hypothetical protein AE02_00697 [Klebsiella variicola]